MGTVRINARPWAYIKVDGRSVGRTGYRGELPVGSPRITLSRPAEDGRSHSQTITVRKDRAATLCWSFADTAPCPR